MKKSTNQFSQDILNIFGASDDVNAILSGGKSCSKDMITDNHKMNGGECGCDERPIYGGKYDHKVKKYLHKIKEYLNRMKSEGKEIPQEYKKYME